jgi:O-antigen ligase
VLVGVSRSGSAGLALIGGVVVIGVGQFLPRLAVMLPALLLLLAFLTAPFLEFLNFILQWHDLAAYLSRFEASIRINIWIFYRDLFWQHPWRGFGFRAERLLDPSLFPTSVTGEAKLHPHHEPLQVLFEFGAIGATLLFGTLFLVTRRLMDNVRPQAVCAAAAVAAYLAAGLVNFSLWESWWLAVASITFVVCNRLWTSGAPA